MSAAARVAFCFHDPAASGASIWMRDFLCADGWPAKDAVAVLPGESPLEESLHDAGIPVRRVRVQLGALRDATAARRVAMVANRLSMVGQYVNLFRRERVRLVYVNSSYQIAPMIAARVMGLPLVVHVHEGWRSAGTHGLKRWAVQRLAHGALFAAQRGMELFGPPRPGRRWVFSPNGVAQDLALLIEKRREIRERLGIEPSEFLCIFLGTLSRRKGTHDLIRVWPHLRRRHPRARLLVGGNVDAGESDPAILGFVSDPPEGARYLGFRRDARELIAAADALVLPSYGEAMPITISEAMMIGTPVVARNVGDVAFQIGEGRGFLFDGRGGRPLLRALHEAISQPGEASVRAARAQEFAREHLDHRRQCDQVAGVIRSFLTR